eukprot:TRINITY_DN22223_c0_g1_i1.p1 TRINITY_DN22223_c0_g1~~TRINITY_DN22223_c0_g1_i1.p1  ORF type:complete len:187 (+),score=28.54 TRINITY_DN22223_c0_g1_i1:170-730(+)
MENFLQECKRTHPDLSCAKWRLPSELEFSRQSSLESGALPDITNSDLELSDHFFDLDLDLNSSFVLPEPDFFHDETSSIAESSTFQNAEYLSKKSTLEDKLDFIINTLKRPPKGQGWNKNVKKQKKTPEQLVVLEKELGKFKHVPRQKIREVAKRIGLKEAQVYKWCWDRRTQSQSETQLLSLIHI